MAEENKKLEYKNQEDIDTTGQKARGERLNQEDLDILPQPTLEDSEFGKPDKLDIQDEFVELHVYDKQNNLLESIYDQIQWTTKKAPGGEKTQGQQLVLKPGDDLRFHGYRVGKFKVVYNFFSELLGDRLGNKVYIEEISPTRQEIRILPVRKHPKASLDPNEKPFIKAGTVYDGTTKWDSDIKKLERVVGKFDEQIQMVENRIDKRKKHINHWMDSQKTFNLTGRVRLETLTNNFTKIPYENNLDEYPNQKYSSLKTKEIIDDKIKTNEESLSKFNQRLQKWKEARKAPQSDLHKLQKWQEICKLMHKDDKKFFSDFYDFTQGNDTDDYTYKEGIIKSTGTIKDNMITIEGGKFQKYMQGGTLVVKNLNTGEITYQAKIQKVKGSKSNPRTLVMDRPYTVKNIPTLLPKTFDWEIQYRHSRKVNRKDLKNLISFGNNNNIVVTNWLVDNITYSDFPFSAILKLYEPLPEDIVEKDQFWLSRERLAPVIENINLFSNEEEDSGNLLRPPNFDVDDKYLPNADRPTLYENWDDLLSTQATTKEKLLNELFSGSLDSARVNVKYQNYEDFIHFSSAEERLKNFRYKLTLLESYDSKINTLGNVTGSENTSSMVYVEKQEYSERRRKLINDFDGYEKHLYYGTQSFSDSGLFSGSAVDTCYPKINSTTLYTVDSPTGEVWMDNQIATASLYDKTNLDSLYNSLPLHITEDLNNQEFFTFMHMIGQHFDTQWQYVKQLTKATTRNDSVTEGMSKDIVYYVAKSFGVEVEKGTDARRLWREYLGTNVSGSADSGVGAAVGEVISSDDYSKEIWNRILNNLPYLLKTKGTSRGIKALLSCYGIPQSILDIREYGGPVADTTKPSYYYKEEFGYGVQMLGDNYISSSWSTFQPTNRYPDGVEIRFDLPFSGMKSSPGVVGKLESTSSFTIMEASGTSANSNLANWSLTVENSGSTDNDYGVVALNLYGTEGTSYTLSSSKLPVYNGKYWSALVQRTTEGGSLLSSDDSGSAIKYNLYVGQYNEEAHKVLHSSYTSMIVSGANATEQKGNASWTSPMTMYIGGGLGKRYGHMFTGSLQEYRTWNGEVLTKDTFLNHVASPKTYTGNTYSSSNEYNTVRYSFNQKKNHSLAGYYTESNGRTHLNANVVDESRNTSQDTPGYTVGFSSLASDKYHYEWEVSENRYLVPNIGTRRPTDKIRQEESELVHGNLNTKKSVERSSLDGAPLDSNRVGVYFSPTNLVNIDIMREFAGLDMGDYVGNPLDRYRPNYPDLDKLRRFYFDKYVDSNGKAQGNLIYEYIKLIDYYDRSLFNMIQKWLPARASKTVGIAIEPHILERSRIEWKPLVKEENNYDGKVDIEDYIARDDLDDGFGATYKGRVSNQEGAIDKDSFFNFFGEQHTEEGGIDPDSYLNFFGEQHTEEGGIDPDSYLNWFGEVSNPTGIIDKDGHFNFTGIHTPLEGEVPQDSSFNLSGRTPNYEGGTEAETQIDLSGTSRRYTGVTDKELQYILSGRTPNYSGGTEAETQIDLTGRVPRYEGESEAENEVGLEGTARTYEGEMMTPLREYFEYPVIQNLNALSWSFVSGSDRGAGLRDVLRGGEVFAEFNEQQDSQIRFIHRKYPSASYDNTTHNTIHPDGAREVYFKSGSIRWGGVLDVELQPYEINKYINPNTHHVTWQDGYVKNGVTIDYKAAEIVQEFSSIQAAQKYEGIKMECGPYETKIDDRGEQYQHRDTDNPLQENQTLFGSGWAHGGGKIGITPVQWLDLSDSEETSDGGPVIKVTETTPTQLIVTTPEQDTNIDTN